MDIQTRDGSHFELVDDDGDYVRIDALRGAIQVGDTTDDRGPSHECHIDLTGLKMLRAWLDGAIVEMETWQREMA